MRSLHRLSYETDLLIVLSAGGFSLFGVFGDAEGDNAVSVPSPVCVEASLVAQGNGDRDVDSVGFLVLQ